MNQSLKRRIFVLAYCLFSSMALLSCKVKGPAVSSQGKKEESKRMTAEKIIKNHYAIKNDFNTLYIKSAVKYSDQKLSQNLTAEIKIKKNEQILVSIRFLGITMAKALISPSSVSYYEKMGGTYFEGDFSSLSKWLGTDLDYNKVQNLLLGQAIDDLRLGHYKDSIVDQSYCLEDNLNSSLKKYFFFDQEKFLLSQQQISQIAENRKIEVRYADHQLYNDSPIPSTINIEAKQDKGTTEIKLGYNTITVNEELSFPYSVPSGYKKLSIK